MEEEPNRIKLIGYLEESLPAEEMTRLEEKLRTSPRWREVLKELVEEVGSGDYSLATIWQRHRLTCASRERLGAYLQGGLVPDEADYIRFHIEVVQCRRCQANLEDVRSQVEVSSQSLSENVSARRRRFFETSVGYLRHE
ncbi:hypothetical protein K2X85_10510 [bacterium]|jgi:hypothetical protein|nr:hypothetical protein [bacterium]